MSQLIRGALGVLLKPTLVAIAASYTKGLSESSGYSVTALRVGREIWLPGGREGGTGKPCPVPSLSPKAGE